MAQLTGVVDYGLGNMYSVIRSLDALGYTNKVITPEEIPGCDYVILPGVGAFGDGMSNIKERGIDQALAQFVTTGRPLLGICLGAQLLMSLSHEFGLHKGLDFIPGEVKAIEASPEVAVPHVGWAPLIPGQAWGGSVLQETGPRDEFYFTHSFSCCPESDAHVSAWIEYGPHKLVAAIGKDNVMGCQFHPELSSHPGLGILKQFHAL